MRARSGGQLLPRTKAHLMWAPRRYFNDLQEWEWIDRRFERDGRSRCLAR